MWLDVNIRCSPFEVASDLMSLGESSKSQKTGSCHQCTDSWPRRTVKKLTAVNNHGNAILDAIRSFQRVKILHKVMSISCVNTAESKPGGKDARTSKSRDFTIIMLARQESAEYQSILSRLWTS